MSRGISFSGNHEQYQRKNLSTQRKMQLKQHVFHGDRKEIIKEKPGLKPQYKLLPDLGHQELARDHNYW